MFLTPSSSSLASTQSICLDDHQDAGIHRHYVSIIFRATRFLSVRVFGNLLSYGYQTLFSLRSCFSLCIVFVVDPSSFSTASLCFLLETPWKCSSAILDEVLKLVLQSQTARRIHARLIAFQLRLAGER